MLIKKTSFILKPYSLKKKTLLPTNFYCICFIIRKEIIVEILENKDKQNKNIYFPPLKSNHCGHMVYILQGFLSVSGGVYVYVFIYLYIL